jgi:hypothetical protein
MNEDEMSGSCRTHRGYEMCIKILAESVKGRGHSEDLGVDGRIILEWILVKQCGKVSTGCIWLRKLTTGGPL